VAYTKAMTPYFDSFLPEKLDPHQLDLLLSLGWYRMHQGIFTTSHVDMGGLYRVHWLRYPIHLLAEKNSHRRIRNRNRKFNVTLENFDPAKIRPDHTDLHARYRASIDFDGALSIEECLLKQDQQTINIFDTRCVSVFDEGKLIAGGYFDVGKNSAASILHFFDPVYARFSLGKYLILVTIDYLKANGFEFYYPGYVVQGLEKMNYKLFLGKEHAEYFEPESASWKKFHEDILAIVK
jgi:arginine-tRNA-protein transferase